ncbi:MAG TPA: rhomboid family intramembrane serine protease [Terriglobales bacterium]|nr:rhomboid family intramembrane serine protease [Terriglobales bacterium]
MSQCAQCGRELDENSVAAAQSSCEFCRNREAAEQNAPQAPVERASTSDFVITNLLLGINVGVYMLMVLKHVSPTSPSTDQIIAWGGNYGPLSLGAQPWRVVTCLFLHIGFLHLLANMWALFVLGRLAEGLFGRWTYLASYMIAGVAGSFASLLWNPTGVSAGASGAIFGIAGVLIAALYVGKVPIPKHQIRPVLATLVFWAAFDLLYGIWKTGVDNAAHIGGVVTGLVLGLILGHHLGPDRRRALFRERALLIATLCVVAFGAVVFARERYIPDIERARISLSHGLTDEALRELQVANQRRPNEAYVLLLMGDAYARKGDIPHAQEAYRRVTQLKPNDAIGWTNLATAYAADQKFPESAAAWVQAAQVAKGINAAVPWFQAGKVYTVMDQQQDAINAYQKALALAPNQPEILGALGFAQLKAGQNPQAVSTLEKAVKLQPGNPELHLILGNAYAAVGRDNEAQEQFYQSSKLREQLQQRLRQRLQQPQARPRPQTSP